MSDGEAEAGEVGGDTGVGITVGGLSSRIRNGIGIGIGIGIGMGNNSGYGNENDRINGGTCGDTCDIDSGRSCGLPSIGGGNVGLMRNGDRGRGIRGGSW